MFPGVHEPSPHVSGFAETVPQINALFGGRWLRKRSRLWVREKPGNMRAVPGFSGFSLGSLGSPNADSAADVGLRTSPR